ncbi:MAG: UDP-N-acetylmuramoyl-tripeptide--D-alanyl-D-alanine ligase [Elusimicrobiales bacterium]|nr:UDP-N-acetylmuramoyl-tripeptide--D-alanyl-D-alanine ligase [Elusimicrobiales bacterium]
MKLEINLKKLAEVAGCHIIKGSPETVFDSFVTDTRKIKEGDFFWALKGASFDASSPEILMKTIPAAKGWIIRTGAAADIPVDKMPDCVVETDDTLKALQRLAAWHRQRFDIPVVSMTGSNGKSTTKEMVRSILSLKGKTCCNAGNLNNQVGVPLSVLELSADDEYGVFELGASHIGDIDEIAAIAQPSAGIITNIAPSHLEFFGSLENVFRTKTELLKHIQKNGTLVYNADDRFLSGLSDNENFRLISFGQSEKADVRVCRDGTLFFRETGEKMPLRLPYPGVHNIMNAAAAAATALSLGVEPVLIKRGLENYSAPAMRMQEIKFNNVSVILDAYNANPQSMSAAFAEMRQRPRPLCFMLGDMKELGTFSEKYHRNIGRELAEIKPDMVFLAGPEMKAAAEEYIKAGGDNLVWAEKPETWLEEARRLLEESEKGSFLIKASRSMRFERITEKKKNDSSPAPCKGCPGQIADWAENAGFAVTVCDADANVIYMNARSRSTFEKYGSMIGKNLKDCHPPYAWAKIVKMLSDGSSNSYFIIKDGVKKFIHQSPWYEPGGTKPAGLVEISTVVPHDMPCYERKPHKEGEK